MTRTTDRFRVDKVQCGSDQAVEASLEEIARRAGVGIGTLYRNLPTRQEGLNARRDRVPAIALDGICHR